MSNINYFLNKCITLEYFYVIEYFTIKICKLNNFVKNVSILGFLKLIIFAVK